MQEHTFVTFTLDWLKYEDRDQYSISSSRLHTQDELAETEIDDTEEIADT